jgi:hypothetical protein
MPWTAVCVNPADGFFALGIEVEILFALLRGKKIGTKSPPERPNYSD